MTFPFCSSAKQTWKNRGVLVEVQVLTHLPLLHQTSAHSICVWEDKGAHNPV